MTRSYDVNTESEYGVNEIAVPPQKDHLREARDMVSRIRIHSVAQRIRELQNPKNERRTA